MKNESLDRYQSTLLDILYTTAQPTAEQIREAAGPFAEDLGELDADLLAVAAELTRTWGRLTS